jgi:hypothetical protein
MKVRPVNDVMALGVEATGAVGVHVRVLLSASDGTPELLNDN